MLDEVLRLAGAVVLPLVAVILIRVVGNLLKGARRVADVREDGGGVVETMRGELIGGQRRPSSSRAHGLHMSVRDDGTLLLREKSVIAKEPA